MGSRALLVIATASMLGACSQRSTADHASVDIGDASTGTSSGSAPQPDPEPDPDSGPDPDPTSESGAASDGADASGSDDGAREGSCESVMTHSVEHVAFHGTGCFDAAHSVVLGSQAEVDGHVTAFCSACIPNEECPNAPHLPPGKMLIYAFAGTPTVAQQMEILGVEDCGDTILVTAHATTTHELALGDAWASVIVPLFDEPVEFDIAIEPPQ